MLVGTRSVVFGVHQFLWHPITVFLAWCELYGMPNWKELVCIFIHDIGYLGKPNMDGSEGETHVLWGAWFATWHLDCFPKLTDFPEHDYHELCLLHSRTFAKNVGKDPSRLCWADKLSIKYDPWWFYLARAWLSGEIWEYRKGAISIGLENGISPDATHREWFEWARNRGIVAAETRNPAKAYDMVTK